VATTPERCASRTISAVLRGDSGKPSVAGSSQAMAFTCTMSSGGKNRGSSRARSLLQTSDALVEEPLAPQAHHVAADGERCSDLIIGAALGGEQHHSGPQDRKLWQRVLTCATLQNLPFLVREFDHEWAFPRHTIPSSPQGRLTEKLHVDNIYTSPYLGEQVLSKPRGENLRPASRTAPRRADAFSSADVSSSSGRDARGSSPR
jgi:hypothetical protein